MAKAPARRTRMAVRLVYWLLVLYEPPASTALKEAKASSPVARASELVMMLLLELLVMLMPSAKVLRMRRFLKVLFEEFTPQYRQMKCSTQTLSTVTFCMPLP